MPARPNCAPRTPAHRRLLAGAAWLALLSSGTGVVAAPDDRRERLDPAAKMPVPTRAEIDETLAIGGEEIDARKLRSRMTVEVEVNGAGPYRFVVDSGADTSVVGRRLADALQLPAGKPTLLNMMTDSRMVERVLIDRLKLGPTSVNDLEVPVLQERNIGAEGMIGLDALVEQRLMLDFEKRVITVDDAYQPTPSLDGEIVVTGRLHRGQRILTKIMTNKVPVEAVIDTGSELTTGNSALRDRLISRDPSKFSTVRIRGVTGVAMDLQIARVSELRLGSVILQNVPVAFADLPPFEVFGLEDEPALLLGTDLMETFRKVSLDFHARKVRFQLRKCDLASVRLSTTTSYATRLHTDQPSACGS